MYILNEALVHTKPAKRFTKLSARTSAAKLVEAITSSVVALTTGPTPRSISNEDMRWLIDVANHKKADESVRAALSAGLELVAAVGTTPSSDALALGWEQFRSFTSAQAVPKAHGDSRRASAKSLAKELRSRGPSVGRDVDRFVSSSTPADAVRELFEKTITADIKGYKKRRKKMKRPKGKRFSEHASYREVLARIVGQAMEEPKVNPEPMGTASTVASATGEATVSATKLPSEDVEEALAGLLDHSPTRYIPGAGIEDLAQGPLGKLPGSPADVTAFHDVDSLRIAMKPLWSEVFDGKLEEIIESVFAEYLGDKDESVNSIEELRSLIERARSMTTPGAPAPDELRRLRPFTALEWEALGQGKRNRLLMVARSYKAAMATLGLTKSDLRIDAHGQGNTFEFHFSKPPPRQFMSWKYAYVRIDELRDFGIGIPADNHLRLSEQGVVTWGARRLPIDFVIYDGEESFQYSTIMRIGGHVNKLYRKQVDDIVAQSDGSIGDSSLDRLAKHLDSEEHRFKLFTPGTVNFGLRLTFRQSWRPLQYQVGSLVKTIPLAPKEMRKYSKKVTRKKSRRNKEIEKSLNTSSENATAKNHSESDIIRNARKSSDFVATAGGGGSIGVVNFNANVTSTQKAGSDSKRAKKHVQDATTKSANELRAERTLEVETSNSEDFVETTSGEISNPNEEMPVTYLLYELERVFSVLSRLEKVEPVLLVAEELPAISAITPTWILRHDWILRRVLLDGSFEGALKSLRKSDLARDITIGVLHEDLKRKAGAFDRIVEQLATNVEARELAAKNTNAAIAKRVTSLGDDSQDMVDIGTTILTGGLFGSNGLLGIGGDEGMTDDQREALEVQQEATLKREAQQEAEASRLRNAFRGAELAVDQATQKYAVAVRQRLDLEQDVLRLRNHIGQNLLHYMQAIWKYESPQQRHLRLCSQTAPDFTGTVEVSTVGDEIDMTFQVEGMDLDNLEYKTIDELAELEEVQGFYGNYAIFTMKEHNYLTAWMLTDYLGVDGGIRDPDVRLSDLLADAKAKLQQQKIRAFLKARGEDFRTALETLKRSDEELSFRLNEAEEIDADQITIPTGELFIEALLGKHTLLEPFKLRHRAMDVAKVAEEVRGHELDNLRKAGRLLEGDYSDPEIDKRVEVSGVETLGVTTDV